MRSHKISQMGNEYINHIQSKLSKDFFFMQLPKFYLPQAILGQFNMNLMG